MRKALEEARRPMLRELEERLKCFVGCMGIEKEENSFTSVKCRFSKDLIESVVAKVMFFTMERHQHLLREQFMV